MITPKWQILLVDDEEDKLESLAEQVRNSVESAIVRTWHPIGDNDPLLEFDKMVNEDTVLVVTDLDLTTAIRGLFGHSVVAWCRNQFIPVGNFSRGRKDALPTEPDLFELRVPRFESDAADYIARMFEGFRRIREGIESNPKLLNDGRSPAHVLANVLERLELESELSPYLSRPGLFNSSLLDTLIAASHEGLNASSIEKTKLLTYILGHVLVNAVLKYPGPILAERPLCAYLAMSYQDIEKLTPLFQDIEYTGPFDGGQKLYWRDRVDDSIERLAHDLEIDDSQYNTLGDYRRTVMERALGCPAANHECNRCSGTKGGFWCPFTKRAVCDSGDCSSTASSWIPSGAYACRVERDFYDEWSPILGL